MKRTLLLVPLLALASLTATAEAGCPRLLTDPAGDVTQSPAGAFPAPVDDHGKIDLLWAQLSSTRSTLSATLRLADLDPEVQTALDHGYELSFTARGERYALFASFDRTGQSGQVSHTIGGTSEAADDPDAGGAYAAEGIGIAQVRLDTHKDTVTITADRSVFDPTGGLGTELTAVRAVSYASAGFGGGGVFSGADGGTTQRTYRLDRRC